jgi:hypothetical protein
MNTSFIFTSVSNNSLLVQCSYILLQITRIFVSRIMRGVNDLPNDPKSADLFPHHSVGQAVKCGKWQICKTVLVKSFTNILHFACLLSFSNSVMSLFINRRQYWRLRQEHGSNICGVKKAKTLIKFLVM